MNEIEPVKQHDLLASPGAMLRQAREIKGMDIAAVAAMLHLTEFRVMAMEADDFASLPEPVFVRGYLKNYARLLNEPDGPILEAYSRCISSVTAQPEHKSVDAKIEVWTNGDHDLVKIASIVLVVLIIVTPIVWWWDELANFVGEVASTEQNLQTESAVVAPAPINSPVLVDSAATESSNDETITESEIKPLPIPLDVVTTAEQPVTEEAPERIKAVIKPLTDTEIKPVESAISEIEPVATENTSIPIPIPQQPVAVDEAKPAVEAVPVPVVTADPIPAPDPKPIKPTPKPQGVWFNFVESGWVKVRDSKNRVILIGEHKKGTRKKLTSSMPYKVVLGNSNAVQIEINGRSVSIDRFSSGGVARFTIDDGRIDGP